MECKKGYPIDCTQRCQFWRSCRARLRDNGGNDRHGNAPRRDNRGRNQRRDGAPRQQDWEPQTCWSFGVCNGTSCPLYGTDKCQRPDLRGANKPEVPAGDENVGDIVKRVLLNGLKKLLGV